MGFLIRFLLLALVVYVIVYIFKSIKKFVIRASTPGERCPSCQKNIHVSGNDLVCPECGTNLGRTQEGKLIIRVN